MPMFRDFPSPCANRAVSCVSGPSHSQRNAKLPRVSVARSCAARGRQARGLLAIMGALLLIATSSGIAVGADPWADHPVNTWVKQSPRADRPPSPRLGYEGACVWVPELGKLVRYGGHNQGGGGEQGAEAWTFDLATSTWKLIEPNTSPPGVCCNTQNVYASSVQRYLRFPLFSGSHGWQWSRELYLNDSSVWSFDVAQERWRNLRPLPAPRLAPYRCASWDTDRQVVVVFGGEGSSEGTLIYDPRRNEWSWPKPKDEPPGRSGGNMAYDAARKLHILFGSQFDDDQHTWAYDLERNEWRDLRPAEQPPTAQNDAVLTYDPIHQVILALVKITTGKDEEARHEVQTWAYDAGANRWTRLRPSVEPDSAGNRTRQLVFAPELNLAILENCTSQPREQQIWTYRFGPAPVGGAPRAPASPSTAAVTAPPPLVEELTASVWSVDRVELHWTAPAKERIAGYHVERAVVEVYSDDQLTRLKSRTPPLAAPAVGAFRKIGPFERLTSTPLAATSFDDRAVRLDQPRAIEGDPVYFRELHAEQVDANGRAYQRAVYAYRVRTVDASGEVGGPSPLAFTIPAAPQFVFSREQGVQCELRWRANLERSPMRYRVYRLDGRYDREPVSRLTPEPIESLEFADPDAGKTSRRYHIVAVDSLGQEGFPSSPVWFQREWRDYYRGFVGEWHQ